MGDLETCNLSEIPWKGDGGCGMQQRGDMCVECVWGDQLNLSTACETC